MYREKLSGKFEFSLGYPVTYGVRSGILEHLLKTFKLASKLERRLNDGGWKKERTS